MAAAARQGETSRPHMDLRGRIAELFTWQLAKTLAMGQGLAVLVCGTAVASQYLTSDFHVDTPMLQSFLNYVLLSATYAPMLLCRPGAGNLFQIVRTRWFQYFLLGLVDVEANYAVVKAYQYTTLTSVQLLDCFVIPVVMVLSYWLLKSRYGPVHYVAVCICLLGVGAMVGADLLAGRDQGSTANLLLGDGLVLLSAALYAVSNVCQEYTVKKHSRVEFLGMVGLFGTAISSVQMVILERHQVAAIRWSWQVGECERHMTCSSQHASLLTVNVSSSPALLLAAFASCMFALYSFMPVVMKKSSAAAVNLSMLTSDLFSLFCGIFLFHYSFSALYLVSLVVILIGFTTFNAVPTPTSPDPTCQAGRHAKAVVDPTKQEEEQKMRSTDDIILCTKM
ncbi:solute carrier family 35 member F2-like isoform X1 [Nerophis lumbriciformis]|uniref:solute carrier family 35 member F2-like isoform X1 n=1 Tax=Nerophis lumbriciformis TaxID=546530 RepID=UPI002AE0A24D|nr:solute carrier family 35 member F2-like isoform X1 [Nerophis lumbriciformis]